METNAVTEWSTALMSSLAAAMALFFSAIPKTAPRWVPRRDILAP